MHTFPIIEIQSLYHKDDDKLDMHSDTNWKMKDILNQNQTMHL